MCAVDTYITGYKFVAAHDPPSSAQRKSLATVSFEILAASANVILMKLSLRGANKQGLA